MRILSFFLKIIAAILVLAALVWVVWLAQPKEVNFADANLEQLVRELLDHPTEMGAVTNVQLREIIELDATGRDIQRLDGIEHMKSLRILILEDNYIRDLTPLASLKRLVTLNLRNNHITSLEGINFQAVLDLPLQHLSLRHNVLRHADGTQTRLSDISMLADLTMLTRLELRDNHISDITPLAGLTQLEVLDISQNPLDGGDISPLSGLNMLRELNIRETGLTDLAPVTNFTRLTYLNIHSNPDIPTLAPLANLAKLEQLIMPNVPLGHEIECLANLHNLFRLNMRNTGLRDLSVLAQLMSQGALQDSHDQPATLDIRENPVPMGGYEPLRPYLDNIEFFDADLDLRFLPGFSQLSREVVINEVMASNGSTIADEFGLYPDWIELYNPGDETIDLTGYFLSDDMDNPRRWQFPHGKIEPGGFLIVWASGRDFGLHTNFNLDGEGELLILLAPDGFTVVDYLQPVSIPRDVSYGRYPDGANNWQYFPEPTPGRANQGNE